MNSKVTISGKIISELSEKIPSNIIALNELIKNSYDAGAKKVVITLDTINQILTICDNGDGMDASDIDALFHISNSNKHYGTINKHNRITQGSKGLGFLSVFKFGDKIEWKTKKTSGLSFSLDHNTIKKADDISKYEVPITEDDTIPKGTTIRINLTKYNSGSLLDHLSKEKNFKKVLSAFLDTEFEIELIINGKIFSSKNIAAAPTNQPEDQLYNVTYNSKTQKIEFTHNGHSIFSADHPFTAHNFTVDLSLVIFQFRPYSKSKIDQLYFNQNDELTPLLYVNNNLFNNYTAFDPNIMKNIKSGQVLNQMIGYINVCSAHNLLDFNSDRTHFLQNELTDNILEVLRDINKAIQITGSSKKNYLRNFDILQSNEILPEPDGHSDPNVYRKYMKSDFQFKDDVKIVAHKEHVEFSAFGKSIVAKYKINKSVHTRPTNPGGQTKPLTTAKINLSINSQALTIPSRQINLFDYIESATDSLNKPIPQEKITITFDDGTASSGIMETITNECKKIITFSYKDPSTGLSASSLELEFIKPSSPIATQGNGSPTISLPVPNSYSIGYNPVVCSLIKQINSLKLDNYIELIACSLRSIFEISIEQVRSSGNYTKLNFNNDLADNVCIIIEYFSSNKNRTTIANSTNIGFFDLKNVLDASKYRSGISTAHLGAHKSSQHISLANITELSRLVALFVVLINEMHINTDLHSK